MEWPINIFFACALAVFSHELGHFLCGRAVGLKTRFGVTWREIFGVRYPNPCVLYEGSCDIGELRTFYVGGFGGELAMLAGLAVAHALDALYIDGAIVAIYAVITTAHFITYPFRNAGRTDNDYRYLS